MINLSLSNIAGTRFSDETVHPVPVMPVGGVNCVIMFVDVAGSTELYDTYGDSRAWSCIGQCQSELTGTIQAHGGIVIKTIGDEIMCRFPHPDAAVITACRINELLVDKPYDTDIRLAVRIGLHFGTGVMDNDDVYGDVVNVATRMTEIAKRGQIIASQDILTRLSAEWVRMTRRFDTTVIKGKPDLITIYEVIWEQEDVTQMISNTTITTRLGTSEITLRYQDRDTTLSAGSPLTLMGRDPQCHFVVKSNLASRIHARIEYRHGKFMLVDQSTNGTYVQIDNNQPVYLRREELPLWGEGSMSLGEAIATDREQELLYFACQ